MTDIQGTYPKNETNVSSETLYLTEMFINTQGEGIFTGSPSFFVRTGGCTVRCSACDTIYSWNKAMGEYNALKIDEIAIQIVESNVRHVVITGGEPADQTNAITALAQHESLRNIVFTVETSGTIDFDPAPFTLLSISPKMKGMMLRDIDYDVYDHLSSFIAKALDAGRFVQIKIVIDDVIDYEQAKGFIKKHMPKDYSMRVNIIFQPNNRDYRERTDKSQSMYNNSLRILNDAVVEDTMLGYWSNMPNVRVMAQQHFLMYGAESGK